MTGWSKDLTHSNMFSQLRIRAEFRAKLAFWMLVHGIKYPWEGE